MFALNQNPRLTRDAHKIPRVSAGATQRGGPGPGLLPAVCLALAAPLAAAEPRPPLPSGSGLAADYPGDEGIEQDAAVVWAERFEVDDLDQLAGRWESVSNANDAVLALDRDVERPVGSRGATALRMTAHPATGADTGGHLYSRLPEELERVFARFYVRFGPDATAYIHHFVHLGGYLPATPWPQGGAGSRPAGDERFTVGIEPTGANGRLDAPGLWTFYAYWCEMKVSAGGRYWGNGLRMVEDPVIPTETWQCIEVMLQLNHPGRRDGELALWIDGKLAGHFHEGAPRGDWTGLGFQLKPADDAAAEPFEGLRWRTDERLKVNFLWLLHYVTDDNIRRNRVTEMPAGVPVWFDHIVVARDYIGPLAEGGR